MHIRPERCGLAVNCIDGKLDLMDGSERSYVQGHRIVVIIISKHPEES